MASRVLRRLRDLLDVDASGLADGDVPTWDAGTSKFTMEPGGSGGSLSAFIATANLLTVDFISYTFETTQIITADNTAPQTGYAGTSTTNPIVAAPMGTVVTVGTAGAGPIPADAEASFVHNVRVIVSNMDGTEAIRVYAETQTVLGETSVDPDFSTAVVTALAGTDLAYDTDTFVISSTAGGVFIATLYVIGGWD